jgi:hypothetical protein
MGNEVHTAQMLLHQLARDLRGEVPLRLHESGFGQSYGLGSSPPFSPEFIGYIGHIECKNDHCLECRNRQPKVFMDGDGNRKTINPRTRHTKAMRKLRQASPIEYDVIWLASMHGLNIEQITARLNDWASVKGYDSTYTHESVSILAICGLDKLQKWL